MRLSPQQRRGTFSEMKSARSFRSDDGQDAYLLSAQKQRSANQASVSTPFVYNSPVPQYTPNNHQSNADDWEYTVLKFGSEISLRGRLGKYLTAVPVLQPVTLPPGQAPVLATASSRSSFSAADSAQASSTAPTPPVQHTQAFLLGVEGQGVGELFDSFVFVNADNRWASLLLFQQLMQNALLCFYVFMGLRHCSLLLSI